MIFRITSFFLLCFAMPAFAGDCMVGGCSSQLCVEEGSMPISTCEWREAYACYRRFSRCEKQTDDICGWTPTEELKRCLENPDLYMKNQDAHDRENH